MLENQFINLEYSSFAKGAGAQPIWLPFAKTISGWNTYASVNVYIDIVDENVTGISLLDANGTVLGNELNVTGDNSNDYFSYNLALLFRNRRSYITEGERYYIRVTKEGQQYTYSSPMIFTNDVNLTRFKYRCEDDAFGFPFGEDSDSSVSIFLPIFQKPAQFVQKDETYEKLDGDIVTLYSKFHKEWECETEYLPEGLHEKIMAMLSCDEIYVGTGNGIKVAKVDNYQIDWENYDLDCDGKTKLAKATFKLRECANQRNSNY